MSKYSAFFAAFSATAKQGNPYTREEMILSFTEGRTGSLKDLSGQELQEITRQLNAQSGFIASSPQINDKADSMRKAIISIFHKMGSSPADAKAWAEKQGVRGQKKPFNDYTTAELYTLIMIAEKALLDHLNAIRKSLSKQ